MDIISVDLLHKVWYDKLRQYLKLNLNNIGYNFETDHEFTLFIRKRVTCVNTSPGHYSLFLNNDRLIGGYIEEVVQTFEENSCLITFNRTLIKMPVY